MNLQTIRQLEDALTAFGAGKNVTVEMEPKPYANLHSYFTGNVVAASTALAPMTDCSARIITPGGFVITVIEKP